VPAQPQRLADNPFGTKWTEFATAADDGVRYRVAGNVGPFTAGDVVAARDLGPGAQMQRLLDAGHLVRLTDEEAEALGPAAARAADRRFYPAFNVGRQSATPPGTEGPADEDPRVQDPNPKAEADRAPGPKPEPRVPPPAAAPAPPRGK
jgi:hypothetical protein